MIGEIDEMSSILAVEYLIIETSWKWSQRPLSRDECVCMETERKAGNCPQNFHCYVSTRTYPPRLCSHMGLDGRLNLYYSYDKLVILARLFMSLIHKLPEVFWRLLVFKKDDQRGNIILPMRSRIKWGRKNQNGNIF